MAEIGAEANAASAVRAAFDRGITDAKELIQIYEIAKEKSLAGAGGEVVAEGKEDEKRKLVFKIDGASRPEFGMDVDLDRGDEAYSINLGKFKGPGKNDVISLAFRRAAGNDPAVSLSNSWIVTRQDWNSAPEKRKEARQAAGKAYALALSQGKAPNQVWEAHDSAYDRSLEKSTFEMGFVEDKGYVEMQVKLAGEKAAAKAQMDISVNNGIKRHEEAEEYIQGNALGLPLKEAGLGSERSPTASDLPSPRQAQNEAEAKAKKEAGRKFVAYASLTGEKEG
ncbi:MAG: hypothetical protein AAB356_05030, partial [Deltaproteobacteria bacterium]